MDLSKRHLEIIQRLLKETDFIKYDKLSEHFKISERSIRYNLEKIDNYLELYKLPKLIKDREKGICIVEKDIIKSHFTAFYKMTQNADYYYSREERRGLITLKLLESEKPLNIGFFQEYFGLSKNTILKELDHIGKRLEKLNLQLQRKPRIGIYIEGKEIDRRRAIIDLTYESVELDDIFNYVNLKVAQSKINNVKFNILFSEFDIDFLNGLVRMAENELKRNFTDEGYGNLITHISLMIKRIQLNKEICLPETCTDGIHCTKEYKVAEEMVKKIEDSFQISIPKDEISYIAIHLLGTKVTDSEVIGENQLLQVINQMIEDIEKLYSVNFKEKKLEIQNNLLCHIRPSVYRIKYGLKLQNPLFDSIYKNYRELFYNTKLVCKHLENYIGDKINDQEISYMTLHFAAALESAQKTKTILPKIILVCATGLGTAQMLATQIDSKFNCEIVKKISSRKINEIKEIDYDYIISTVQIPQLDESKYIRIGTMLLAKDLEKLTKYLEPKYQKIENNMDKRVESLMAAVEKYAFIKDREQLAYEFLYIMKSDQDRLKIEEKIYMLEDLLIKDTISLNQNAKNWKEAIEIGANILIEKGDIEKTYIESILKSFEELGPYMVVAPGIVLSHARPEDGVNNVSMSLVTLKSPIEFGSELNDPVKLIITLAANDNTSHLKALSQLMNLFMDGEDLRIIMETNDKQEILNLIKKHSKN